MAKAATRLPSNHRVYAIGDVHGHLGALLRLEAVIDHDLRARPVDHVTTIYLGDYIDRGPDSRGVIDHLARKADTSGDIQFLKGNHDATLQAFLENPAIMADWRRFGGLETLCSYGVDVRMLMRGVGAEEARAALIQRMPPSHVAFLDNLQSFIVMGGYCFVHAGLKPGVALDQQTDEARLWIRDEFLNYRGSFGTIVVHGHTPVEAPDVRPNRIAVDTGVYLTGRLTAAVVEGNDVRFLSSEPTGGRRS